MTQARSFQCLIVSGRSGSGKSTALQALEDLGYYCVDNMPLILLPDLISHLQQQMYVERVAIGIDARNLPEQLVHFKETLSTIKSREIAFNVIYLDADNKVLLQRFDATRRKHPLSSGQRSLSEAIEYEHQILADIRAQADITIDTSTLDAHSLRDAIRSRTLGSKPHTLNIQIMSFGFKHGVPQDADLMFDVRVLPNPYWQPELRQFNGTQQPIIEFLSSKPESQQMLTDIKQFISHWLPAYKRNDRNYLTITIGCTGGQHRSVYIASQLTEQLKQEVPSISLRHRDCKMDQT